MFYLLNDDRVAGVTRDRRLSLTHLPRGHTR
jgi:hypothetical protein